MKKTLFILATFFFLQSCGTLGGFEIITLPASESKLNSAIDSLYKNFPEYKIPTKWNYLNDWEDRGYGFLDGKIFYFNNDPEEMYYVSFIHDDSVIDTLHPETRLSIRAVNKGQRKWLLKKDLNGSEQKRIIERFKNEIISKLKNYIR